MAEGYLSQSRCTPTQQTNTKWTSNQVAHSSRRHVELSQHANENDLSSNSSPIWPEPAYPSMDQSQSDKAASSTREKRKMGQP